MKAFIPATVVGTAVARGYDSLNLLNADRSDSVMVERQTGDRKVASLSVATSGIIVLCP